MKTDFTIRQAQQSDAVELKELFQNTVLVINRRDYSQAEVEDWASCGNNLSNIKERIETHCFVVAVNQQSQIVGFSSITSQGYLHSMFVHKDFQGEGIATMLLEEIERYAITAGITRITSEVSLTARPFFEKKGYIVKEEQKRKANQLSLTNFWMAREMAKIKPYNGRIPACGVFCGGCPIYTREKRACRGAELNLSRCEKCKTFHLCCFGKKITHCFQCSNFPCTRFKGFAKRWQKHGQDFIENQKLIEVIGEMFDSVYADQLQMQITVNSSSYAVKFYESLGFSKTSEEQETDGLKYTPMHYCPLRMDGLITG